MLGWGAMWGAHLSVGGFKGEITPAAKLLFFLFFGLSCLLAFGSLLLLSGTDRSANSWVPVIGLVIMGATAAIITPVLASTRAASTHTACLSNTRQILTAIQMYAADWDERLPSSARWQDQIAKYTRGHQLYRCPIADLPFAYGMNKAFSELSLSKIKDPEKMIVIFESWSGENNFSGTKQDFVARHGNRGTVGFATGKAVLIQKDNQEVIWNP